MASNGKVRLRDMQSADKYDITIHHGPCTEAQRQTLMTFYTTNRSLAVTFTADEDGVARSCYFADPPYTVDPLGNSLFAITVNLTQA
jgi:hypothetical protein